jgi:hypothetical protein
MCFNIKNAAGDDDHAVGSSAPLLAQPGTVYGTPAGDQLGGGAEDEAEWTEYNAKFTNYDPNEEATCIKSLTYLQVRPFRCYFVAPLLTICTAFIFGLCLFWYDSFRAKFFYKKVKSIEQATHIMIDGLQTKDVVVAELFQGDQGHPARDTFTFRFINF